MGQRTRAAIAFVVLFVLYQSAEGIGDRVLHSFAVQATLMAACVVAAWPLSRWLGYRGCNAYALEPTWRALAWLVGGLLLAGLGKVAALAVGWSAVNTWIILDLVMALFGKIGEHPPYLFACLAAIKDEAPGLHAAMVGYAAGDADQGRDLRIRGRRFLQFMDRRRIARDEKVDDRRRHGQILSGRKKKIGGARTCRR